MIAKLSALAAAAALSSIPLVAQQITAVKAGTLYTGDGQTLRNAVVLIKDGRIEKIGTDIEVPWNASVLDASKHHVMPAWIQAHASSGMDRDNENLQVTPYLSVADAVDPSHPFFDLSRRNGVATLHVLPGDACAIGGRGMVLRPNGKTPEQMAVVPNAGMKMSLLARRGSRTQHVADIEKAFDDAKAHREDWERRKKEFDEDKKNGATTKEKFEDELDPLKVPVLDLLDRKTTAYLYVPRAADLPVAMSLVQKYNLLAVFVLGGDCYKAVDLLKTAHRNRIPLILDPQLEIIDKDPVTEAEELVCPARVLYDAGIPFAITAEGLSAGRFPGMGGGASRNPALQMPWWQVATCVRHGMPEKAAIEAFTTIPASILGLSDRLGTLTVGKDANLQVLSAAPLEPECQVDYLVIEGMLAYDRSKDPRVQELTGKTSTSAEEGKR